jgi:TatD DNase family protein
MTMSIPYLDIHTHKSDYPASTNKEDQEKVGIYTLSLVDLRARAIPKSPLAAGLHPWEIDEKNLHEDLKLVRQLAENRQTLLIGECGLDKLKGPPLSIQTKVYEEQILIANEVRKPIIIHCVKAYDEIISVHKRLKCDSFAIMHGFNKSPELAAQLLKSGFLLSFGAALTLNNGQSATAESLKYCAENNYPFFLETDTSDLEIESIYNHAANQLKISEDALKDVIFANWKKVGIYHE